MANTPTVYVVCDQNCKWESMTKEQILTAITQAVENGSITDIDTGFVQTIKTINGTPLKFFVGTQSEYDVLTSEDRENLFAIITNDTNKEGIEQAIQNIIDGVTEVGNATNATNAKNASKINDIEIKTDENGVIKIGDLIIPQKRLLWSGRKSISSLSYVEICRLENTIQNGSIEIVIEGRGNLKANIVSGNFSVNQCLNMLLPDENEIGGSENILCEQINLMGYISSGEFVIYGSFYNNNIELKQAELATTAGVVTAIYEVIE